MRVKDNMAWSQQASELLTGDEASQKFHDFLVFWVDTAEYLGDHNDGLDARNSLIEGFEIAEQKFGFLSVEWLSQMLLVVVQHWVNGDAVWESLSAWERRLIEQATALKLTELQQRARIDAESSQDDDDSAGATA